VTSGNLIACAVSIKSTSITVSSLSDTQTNTYTLRGTYYLDTTNTERILGAYATNVTGPFTVVTVTLSSSLAGHKGVVCHEISGADTTSPDDGYVGNWVTSMDDTTDGVTSTAITTTANGDYIFGATYDSGGGCTTVNAGTSFTGHTLSGCQVLYSEHRIQSSAGSVAATFTSTWPVAENNFVTIIQAFKAQTSARRRIAPMLLGE